MTPMTPVPSDAIRADVDADVTPADWRAWRAPAPSAGFSDRAVAAILRDRGDRRRASIRRAAWLGALAAVLTAGAAYGWTARVARRPASLPAAPAPDPGPVATSVLAPPLVGAPVPAAPVPAAPAPPLTPVHRRGAPPQLAASASGRPVPMPRCSCQAWFCDCVETP